MMKRLEREKTYSLLRREYLTMIERTAKAIGGTENLDTVLNRRDGYVGKILKDNHFSAMRRLCEEIEEKIGEEDE